MTTESINLCTPWSLHFDRDGTEDYAIIFDAEGHDLVQSTTFWLPEEDDAAVRARSATVPAIRSAYGRSRRCDAPAVYAGGSNPGAG